MSEKTLSSMNCFHTPESGVLVDSLKYLQARGIFHWRNNTGAVRVGSGRFMHFGKKGSSDILAILPGGRFLAVECKAPDGRLSLEQREFLERIRDLGGMALVVRSWEELDKILWEAEYVSNSPLFEHTKLEEREEQ